MNIKTDTYGLIYVVYNGKRFYNMTEHNINIVRDNFRIYIPPSGLALRLDYKSELETQYGEVPVYKLIIADNVNPLPRGHYNENYVYIVSNKILKVTDKDNFYSPHILVRNKRGHVVACEALTKRTKIQDCI